MDATPKRFISVGTKLAVGTTLLVAVLAGLIYSGLTRFQWKTTIAGKSSTARMVGALFREVVATPVVFDDQKGVDEAVKSLMANHDVLGVRISPVKGDKALAESRRDGFTEPLEEQWTGQTSVAERGETLLLVDGIKDSDGAVVARAVVAFSLAKELEDYGALSQRILITAAVGALALIIVLLVLVHVIIVRPMQGLAQTAEGLQAGQKVATGVRSADEVGALARALDAMAHAVWAREADIAQRNRDMKLVLDSVSQGFLLLGPDGVMGPQRSAVLGTWFGEVPASGRFADWVSARAKSFGPQFDVSFTQLGEGFMPLDVCVDMLPRQFECEGLHFALTYKALLKPGTETLENLLVVISDVSAEIERQHAATAQREVIEIFQWLMRDRAGFASFLEEGTAIVKRLADGGQPPTVELREVHTLKGNSALLGVQSVASVCHRIETRLAEEGGAPTDEDRAAIGQAWSGLRGQVSSLGGDQEDGVTSVPNDELEALLAGLTNGTPARALAAQARSWKDEPVVNRLKHLGEQARALSKRLGRGDPNVILDAPGLRLPHARFAAFWSSAVHVVRNAVDHGFEAPADRRDSGKAASPRLELKGRRVGESIEFSFSDDGRGVAWERIAQKARARGLGADTQAQLVDALFADGVSSRDEATETSGRGVGMSAVKQAVEALGGRVTVQSEVGKGTTFTFVVPAEVTPRVEDAPHREVA